MIKKRIFLTFLISFLMISFAIAQSNESNNSSSSNTASSTGSGETINKAYQCLENQIDSKQETSISLQEAIFGLLALGSDQKLISVIEEKSINGNHWGESGSEIKDTAQVLLAYNRINKNTENIKSWLLSKEISSADLLWFIQIDIPTRNQASCTLSYKSEEKIISLNSDQTLSGNPGSCLSISNSGFWLKVNNNCIDENFTISCDEDFVSSLLYQRSSASTIFVSPETHSAAALGTTLETINSKCLSSSNSCDYEGTLWSAIALDSSNSDSSKYLPYLLALSENNVKYLPSAFLHKITLGPEQYSQLIQSQQQNKYWQAPNTPYNRFYDSALAMLSLQSSSAIELSNSKDYFESITTTDGCWNNNNIRDTGFLLYSGWPKTVQTSSSSSTPSCISSGYSCTSEFSCSSLNGSSLSDYYCSSGICCSEKPAEQSCSAQNGLLCTSQETCSGTSVSSLDGSCCLGSCTPLPSTNECETSGGACWSECDSDEEQKSFSCTDAGDVCCISSTSSSEGSSLGIWITILIILIVLIALAIIFRKRIQLIIFKRKNQGGPSPTKGFPPGRRPPFPPGMPMMARGQPRRILSSSNQGQNTRPSNSKEDREMEETMRKLKEMSN
ncbi:MAG: hypothetical protein Q8P57_03810 [Candidatus Pacearchaeota archaeon]|nr:hypothetical protein [Candidatus Pacearchaeota archaeon]